MSDAPETNPPNGPQPLTARLQRMGVATLIERKGLSFWEMMALTGFMVGTLTVGLFANTGAPGFLQRFALLFAVACGAWMGGGFIGFLFGVPRYKSADGDAQAAQPDTPAAQVVLAFSPNTNLEQISDWLSKIIVGATLVQLGQIFRSVGALCVWIGQQLNEPTAAIFAGGILAFFFLAGFMWGYLWSSIRIFREMVRLTEKLQDEQNAPSE